MDIKDLEKQKKQLKASYEMWEKTISDTYERCKEAVNEDGTKKYTEDEIKEKIDLLRNGQQDIIEKWALLGCNVEELTSKATKKSNHPVVKKKAQDKSVLEKIKEAKATTNKKENKSQEESNNKEEEPVQVRKTPAEASAYIPKMDDTNPMASYDIIPLPSNGECYKNKQGRIAVSYLTAMDENIIVSPNLYRDNMVLDILLKEKIRDPEINADDLLDGDRDAIILFLRSSAYGNMYSVTTTDPDTKKTFDVKIDLSKIKYKDFNLVGDENGYFDFELPLTKDKVKFRFLTHKDYVDLAKVDEIEVAALRKAEIEKYNEKLKYYLEEDDAMTVSEKKEVQNAVKKLEEWAERFGDETMTFSHKATNELEMEIVSINDNADRGFIHNYVVNMPIKDATALRRYITKNTPGVDYNFEIEKPEGLGGGSMKVFLQFDQFIFLADSDDL